MIPGSNPGGGEIFLTCPDRPWGAPSLLYNGYRVFPGGKAAGAWRLQPTPSSAEIKERVVLYLYSPSGPSWPILGWTLPLPFLLYTVNAVVSTDVNFQRMEVLWNLWWRNLTLRQVWLQLCSCFLVSINLAMGHFRVGLCYQVFRGGDWSSKWNQF
jgi:hypothetical protein